MIKSLLENYNQLVENRINEVFPETKAPYNTVIEAARYSLLQGGKRIRPAIMLEFCKLCGGDVNSALDFAVALEMIHTYSLIHDDLPCMDDDDMRRGKPSCHKKYGEDIALLAGDTLLTKAFYVATLAPVPAARIAKVVELLSAYSGEHGMIGGQVLDLSFERANPTAKELEYMYTRKTGALLCAAAEIGSIAAGKSEQKHIDKCCSYARNLGLAFQIIDDILDATSDEETLGKPIGSDEKNNKTTFVTLYGIEKAKEIATELTNRAIESLTAIEGDHTTLLALTDFLLNRKY